MIARLNDLAPLPDGQTVPVVMAHWSAAADALQTAAHIHLAAGARDIESLPLEFFDHIDAFLRHGQLAVQPVEVALDLGGHHRAANGRFGGDADANPTPPAMLVMRLWYVLLDLLEPPRNLIVQAVDLIGVIRPVFQWWVAGLDAAPAGESVP